MPEEPEGSQSASGWEVNTIRATTFVGPDFDVNPETSWWDRVVENPSQESRSRRNTGELLETGEIEGKRLVLDIKPGRADWRLTALAGTSEELPDLLPTIGPLEDVLIPFLRLTNTWLEVCPTVTRLAFGAILIKPVPSRETGYTAMATLLPKVEIDPENSFDFLYQINRPRDTRSGISGLRINRLTKWSVLATTLFQVAAGAGGARVQDARQPRFYCKLELDMNTAVEFSAEFSRESTQLVFEELVHLGREIAVEGDIQ